MYLSDQDLLKLLPQLAISVEDEGQPFSVDDQIQPSSIDLRLSYVFWRPQKRFTVDLRRAKLLEIQPRRYYRRVRLKAGESITIHPREMLLGRTLEEFTIPNGFAGELIGRSSFARMGLMVNTTGGHINPGWRGHMPLQLVNFNPNAIRLVPGLPICQVLLTKLSTPAEKPYGHPDLQSKYLHDDGGPSYWWRDKRIRVLHTLLAERVVEERIQQDIERIIGTREPEIVERLEKMIRRMRVDELHSADSVLENFSASEDRRRTFRQWAINLSRASFAVGITASLWVANKLPPVHWWHCAVWVASAALLALSVVAFRKEAGDHFGTAELRASRSLDSRLGLPQT